MEGKEEMLHATLVEELKGFDLVWCTHEELNNVWPKMLQKSTKDSARTRALRARFLSSLFH